MIKADFKKRNNTFCSVAVSGHAGYAAKGGDIVCAAVTSAFQMCANGITDVLGEHAQVDISDNTALISLPRGCLEASVAFIEAFHLHLTVLREQYAEYIEITSTEVA